MDGARVGAVSGAFASIPFLFMIWLVFGVVFSGAMMGGMPGGMGIPGAFGVVVFGVISVLVWTVVLSAVGGYLGAYLATETDLNV